MAAYGERERDVIFVSNRLPFLVNNVNGVVKSSLASSDLVTALEGILTSTTIRWLGWPGIKADSPEERKIISNALAKENAVGIFLDERLADGYYNRFSNSILWPVLHYQHGVVFDQEAWESYKRVNEIFAETVANEASDGDLIWIHDYHLQLLPKLLREQLNRQGKYCAIGFTVHTPFPGGDFWREVPVKKELLEGILASDVIGFHTDEYKRNFIRNCSSSLGAFTESVAQIKYRGHGTLVNTFLLGIDPQKYSDSKLDPAVRRRVKELEAKHKDMRVLFGLDRLDHTKRMTQKLKGYDYFFDAYPELKGKVILVQAAVPSQDDSDDYDELESDISMLADKINEKHSTPDWSPLIYLHHSFSFTELTALCCISNICFLASRRGGMNLVASEFVACQDNKDGILVLSETSGAESFLNAGSLVFNATRAPEVADVLYKAVMMNEDERKERFRYVRQHVTTHTSAKWGKDFIRALANCVPQEE